LGGKTTSGSYTTATAITTATEMVNLFVRNAENN